MKGCNGSGLIHAFSRHVLHRLNIEQKDPEAEKLRVTFLSNKQNAKNINADEVSARGGIITDIDYLRIF